MRKELDSIIHCFRTPVGGVFRHVCDVATKQAELGLSVGVVCDSTTGGSQADVKLEELARHCKLGVHRVPMSRLPHLSDISTQRFLTNLCRELRPAIMHGHGAKGGAYTRLLPRHLGAKRIYTPHGGVLHYDSKSLAGMAYFALERYLQRGTDGLVFTSEYSANKYNELIGNTDTPVEVIYNGLNDEEFVAIPDDHQDHDFVFVGEIRKLKGLDTLLQAMVRIGEQRNASLIIFGAGPDEDFFSSRIHELGLSSVVSMMPPIFPVTGAFERGRTLVIPSYAESLPYIVLEATAASMPLITTNVGGIPEIFGQYAKQLVPPGDSDALADAMQATLDAPEESKQLAQCLAERVQERFRIEPIVDSCLTFYRQVLREK